MGKGQVDEAKAKALEKFHEEVRLRGKVTHRTAIVDEERKEFFRGKDLLRYCEAHPEKLKGIAKAPKVEEQVQELVEHLLSSQNGAPAIVACDRFYKKPHPGRKRLVKYPRKLELRPRPQKQCWDPEAFYVWIEDRPMAPWQIALAGLMAVAILACCLFPLAPNWARSGAVYLFLGLLGGIFALIALRFFLFLIVFTFAGYEFWLFPNLLSDKVDLIGAFIPLQSFQKPSDGKSHLGTRIGGFVGVSFMMYAFYVYSPDESITIDQGDSIIDMFKNVNKPGIGPGSGYGPPQFGNDRNVDIEKIRQARLLEIQRRKEEAQKRKAAGLGAEDPVDTGPEIPSLTEVLESDEEDTDEGAAASAAAQQAAAEAVAAPQADGGDDGAAAHLADSAAATQAGATQGAQGAPESVGAATHSTADAATAHAQAGSQQAAGGDAPEASVRTEL